MCSSFGLCRGHGKTEEEEEEEEEFFIAHKEADFNLWNHSIHVFLICVSFLKKSIYTLKQKVSMHE